MSKFIKTITSLNKNEEATKASKEVTSVEALEQTMDAIVELFKTTSNLKQKLDH